MATLGNLKEAKEHATASITAAERLGDRYRLVSALHAHVVVSPLEGDWRAAREFSNRALALALKDAVHLGFGIHMAYEVGDFAQGEGYLERLLEVMHYTEGEPTWAAAMVAWGIPSVARITGKADRFDAARAAAEAVLSSPSTIPMLAMMASVGLAFLAAMRGDEAAAREQYAPASTTAPVIDRNSRPEVSTNPPSPPFAPPRAVTEPKKDVASSAQTMTLPPSPTVMALARSLASPVTKVRAAVRVSPLPW